MEFPITELLDYDNSVERVLKHFHPKGLKCPKCQRGVEQSRKFPRTQASELEVHRCKHCGTIYNLYNGAIFQGSQWRPMQVVLLMRGICKGETTRELAAELELNYKTVLPCAIECKPTPKATCTPIPTIRPGNKPTNNADTGRTRMIVLPSSERWDGKAGKCAYA